MTSPESDDFLEGVKSYRKFFNVTNEMSIAAFESVRGKSQEIGENSVKLFSFNFTANAGVCMRVGLQQKKKFTLFRLQFDYFVYTVHVQSFISFLPIV